MGRVFTSSVVITEPPDADTLLWVQAANGNGGSVSQSRQNLINSLITGLKADGVWAKLDELFMFAGENQPSALTGLIRRILAETFNSPTFTVDEGYTGDGAAAYVYTNFNPVTISPAAKYLQDDACMFVWNNLGGNDSGTLVGHSPEGPGDQLYLNPEETATPLQGSWTLNTAAAYSSFVSPGSHLGLWILNRAAFNSMTLYQNGSNSIDGDTALSTALLSNVFTALQDGGTYFSTRQVCCMGFGQSLTTGEIDALYQRLREYMTAVGVP